tara:strand:- start:1084 stop:1320 length:237 start_codon:yes stop_codon:yes gene_type:complete
MNIRSINPKLCNGDYLTAQREYKANRMHEATAIGMIANDKDFIAECELRGMDIAKSARDIVRDQWAQARYLSAINHTD